MVARCILFVFWFDNLFHDPGKPEQFEKLPNDRFRLVQGNTLLEIREHRAPAQVLPEATSGGDVQVSTIVALFTGLTRKQNSRTFKLFALINRPLRIPG
ncbi:MAG: hypothetical protein ACR2IV_22975 [Bryobacteraceae bacterium]